MLGILFERGEWIITDDPDDNEPPKPAKVEWLIRNRTDRLYTVEWDCDGDARTDAHVRATSEHPFYALGRGWTPAKDLQPGDRILTDQQQTVTITVNHVWIAPSATYNLDVGEPHTYFVGNSESWLLVHNAEWDIVPYHWRVNYGTSGVVNHHGIMNEWLTQHLPNDYIGRYDVPDFPTIEMSEAAHNETKRVENQFMRRKGLHNGTGSWKEVTPQEMVEVFKEGLRRAGAPPGLDEVYLNYVNGWSYYRRNLWRCP